MTLKRVTVLITVVMLISHGFAGTTYAHNEPLGLQSVDTEVGIESVEIVEKVDRDNDGYVSDFKVQVDADTAHPDKNPNTYLLFHLVSDSGLIADWRTETLDDREQIRFTTNSTVEQAEVRENLPSTRSTLYVRVFLFGERFSDIIPKGYTEAEVDYEPPSEDPPTGSGDGNGESRVTLDLNLGDGGAVRFLNDDTNRSYAYGVTTDYEEGTNLTLVAEPRPGYAFERWEGDVPAEKADQKRIAIELTSDTEITAVFGPSSETVDNCGDDTRGATVELDVNVSDGGNVSLLTEDSNRNIDERLCDNYEEGAGVTLIAEAEEGYGFEEWTGDVPSDEKGQKSITIYLTSDTEINASFSPVEETPSGNETTATNARSGVRSNRDVDDR